jgi:hypothetical protein
LVRLWSEETGDVIEEEDGVGREWVESESGVGGAMCSLSWMSWSTGEWDMVVVCRREMDVII